MTLSRINIGSTSILIVVLIMLLSACKKTKTISGNEFVSRDVFIEVTSEIYIINGITNDISYYRRFNPADSIDIYTSIFEQHDITKEEYEKTLTEYSKHPDLLDKVYDEVLMQLKILQEKVDNDNLEANKPLDLRPKKHK